MLELIKTMTVPETYLENPFFDHLSDHEKSVLNSNASLMKFEQEEMFIKNESLLLSVFYIYKGEVKLKDSEGHLVDIYGEKDFIGLRYLFTEEPVFFSAYGVKGTEIIQFEKNVYRKFVATNSKFLVEVYNKSNENMNSLVKNLLSYKRNKVNGALANFLLCYSEKGCLIYLKQKEISDMLGYSRENINKCLNNFTAEGYIEYTDENIKIKNIEALQSIKKFG
ncbi:cAMP-binding domain of CRP or a regulatory subunit of cAMP-dependent protein kinases [Kaistella chaponensis]|uniref:cAMP-binding domain of CRP or a regulatory subunit of cAMP-dependent protein kinases n=2 Tax=Kaistella chaponensis TaxID=713588 RepID=A0A1N7MM72_9FLAO|nr:cAMP-binding domain of CRP or a regulatory subunit of cAMP-dependent protein kinases [Kaistella chaponensis]